MPSGWSSYWSSSKCPVVWGYVGEIEDNGFSNKYNVFAFPLDWAGIE